ncbi:uracil phosphoribosyltransferase [Flexistipes sinusarabici DSM 4947]|uniref:Uracil phosphoribosyltransferase n=2 Tax=Flexistipes sinusarabici TaxID=2352 RepID=F8E606_FLESM|nr:uracil phosphoribosyltransferase [Flexistipes sinusarabici]AEI14714.1 uracil phosphoribosyltransferase [Flexistipes sinusarabici DSM 4947]HCW94159.1 uracil phosphoribosyltransferase [Flexistipes sinusarabici]
MNFENFHIIKHPLIEHKLTYIREKHTSKKEFKELVDEVALLMAYEITKDFSLQEIEISTPICKTKSKVVSGKKVVLVPILRAGLGMVDGILKLIPSARVGHIGLYRDEKTLKPVSYYFKIPSNCEDREFILVDPMLATGGSAVAAADMLKKAGAKNIKFMCLIAAPEGVEKFCKAHPDVKVYAAGLDEKLNEHGYIVPGLGDAGDRLFGTK